MTSHTRRTSSATGCGRPIRPRTAAVGLATGAVMGVGYSRAGSCGTEGACLGHIYPMTHRLYYTDSYLRDFDAVVVDRAEAGRRIYLDRTAFYPTSGGQPHDSGTLAGTHVLDVVDEGDRIAHLLAAP